MLVSSHAKHRLTVDVWGTMSAAQREKASQACFTLPAPPSSTSTDGSMTVPLSHSPQEWKRNPINAREIALSHGVL